MNKNYFIFALLLCACSHNNIPTSRVHGAASVPRFVDVSTFNFVDSPADPEKGPIGMNIGAGYGLSWADSGNPYGAQIFHIGANYRTPKFAFGITPYLGLAQVSHEGTGVFGYHLWYALHFGGGDKWKFSYQNSLSVANKTNEETGCKDAALDVFGTECATKQTFSSRVEVKIKDVGFIFTAEKHLSGSDSLVIAPGAYWTWISASSKLDVDSQTDYNRRSSFWSPGLQLGYIMRWGEKLKTTAILMAGAQYVKSFSPGSDRREWLPSGDIRFQF